MAPKFGFEMNFKIIFENATLLYSSAQQITDENPSTLKIFTNEGKTIFQKVPKGDGYYFEIKHFVDLLSGKFLPTVITPEESEISVKIIEAEKESIRTNKKVTIN
mgnify:CR=1 FL=1